LPQPLPWRSRNSCSCNEGIGWRSPMGCVADHQDQPTIARNGRGGRGPLHRERSSSGYHRPRGRTRSGASPRKWLGNSSSARLGAMPGGGTPGLPALASDDPPTPQPREQAPVLIVDLEVAVERREDALHVDPSYKEVLSCWSCRAVEVAALFAAGVAPRKGAFCPPCLPV